MIYVKRTIKRVIISTLLTLEAALFCYSYIWGHHGIAALMELRTENSMLEKEITETRTTLAALATKITHWQTDHFLWEKIAREQLQMICEGEEIYYLT